MLFGTEIINLGSDAVWIALCFVRKGGDKQVCLVSSEGQKKANQLAKLQQRVIALLVKNNDRAIRR